MSTYIVTMEIATSGARYTKSVVATSKADAMIRATRNANGEQDYSCNARAIDARPA